MVYEEEIDTESHVKLGRKSSNRGKMIQVGTKTNTKSFWDTEEIALKQAIDDNFAPEAQPGGNYKKAKDFLRNEWKHIEIFTLPDLKDALAKKYPEQADYGGFRLQRWHEATYWENGCLAIKPIWKKESFREYLNIFFDPSTVV